MMLELGVVELEQVTPFIKQFRLLDVDGNARLGRDDLDSSCEKSLAELQLMAVRRMQSQKSMRVGDRVGLTIGSSPSLIKEHSKAGEALSRRGDTPTSAPPSKAADKAGRHPAESSTSESATASNATSSGAPLVPSIGRAQAPMASDDALIASARLLDA